MGVMRTRSRGRLLAGVIAGLLAIGLLWGITSAMASSDSPSPAAGKTILRLGWTTEPDNLNPFIGYESSSYEIWAINYELLVGFRASDYANVPGVGLATDWQTSDDGKVWTFTITDKSKWQDGLPLTAKDVAFTFNYVIDNELGMFIDYIKFIEKVEAPDATHVVFTCSKPKANMLGLWIPILPEHIWSKVSPKDVEKSFKNPPPIIGSGPFQTVEWKKGDYARLVANKDYWRGAPKVDEVIFQMYQNQDTMAQDLKTGAIQSAWNIPSAQFDALNSAPRSRGHQGGHDRVRRARLQLRRQEGLPQVDRAIRCFRIRPSAARCSGPSTRTRSSPSATATTRLPADTIVTRDFYSAEADYHLTPASPYTFDLDKARQALDAAGYPDANGDGIREYKGKPIKLRLYARSESPESQNCGKLITGWFKDIGLDIDYQVIDQRRPRRQAVQLRRQGLRAGLRHVHLGLGRGRRPELHPLGAHDQLDRELERLHLVQRRVRQAVPAAADDDRRPGAHRDRQADAADRLRRVAVHPARLPARPRGGQQGHLDRLGAGRTRTRAPGGTTPSPTPTWRCTPDRRGGRPAAARAPAPSSAR